MTRANAPHDSGAEGGNWNAPIPRADDGVAARPPPPISAVPPNAALDWLARGWNDLIATRFVGLFYGAAFVAMGYAIVWVYAARWQLTTGLIGGFFLMGPFLCTGLYELSRQRARGERISLGGSIACLAWNPGSIGLFALLLTFLMIVWVRVSVLLFALFSTADIPTLQGVLGTILSLDNAGFVALWFGVGFLFASLAFAVGVVSVPMILDRGSDTLEAVFTSVRALIRNPRALYLWAAVVVVVIGLSLALGMVPLLVTAPLIGHATWHAYADLVGVEGADGRAEQAG